MKIRNMSSVALAASALSAIALGWILGATGHADAAARFLEPLANIFFRFVRLVVVPMAFLSMLSAALSCGDVRRAGRLYLRTILLFFATSLFAAAFAVTVGLAVRSRAFPALPTDGLELHGMEPCRSMADAVLCSIPESVLEPFVGGGFTQLQFVAVLLVVPLLLLDSGLRRRVAEDMSRWRDVFDLAGRAMAFLLPAGSFCLLCAVVAKGEAVSLGACRAFVWVAVACLLAHLALIQLPMVFFFAGIGPVAFLRSVFPVCMSALCSFSSTATYPVAVQSVRKLGIDRTSSDFVLSIGLGANANGSAIFHGLAAVFIARCYGVPLGFGSVCTIILSVTVVSMLFSEGSPGSAIPRLGMVLAAIGVPAEGVALVVSAGLVLDPLMTAVNAIGDISSSMVVSAVSSGGGRT